MSLVYGFLAGVGICAALAALAIAAQRDRRQRRQIADLAGQLAAAQARETAAGQRLEAEMAMRLDLMNQSLEARERENRRLQAALSDLEPRARHDRLSRVHRDLGEADLFAFVKLRDELLTAAEIMVSITCLEFSYTQAPKRMKSIVMSVYLLSVSAGNLFTSLVNSVIQNEDGTSALPGASYYWFFTGLMGATAVVFVVYSQFYKGRTYVQGEGEPIEGMTASHPGVLRPDQYRND